MIEIKGEDKPNIKYIADGRQLKTVRVSCWIYLFQTFVTEQNFILEDQILLWSAEAVNLSLASHPFVITDVSSMRSP